MSECFKCGVRADRALLSGAVTENGIMMICRKCSYEESVPIIKNMKWDEEKKQTVHERLSKLAGINDGKKESVDENFELRKIAEENFDKSLMEEKPKEMINNFHWIIMRARRSKKLTQRQFADKIGENEKAIIMAERGILPKNNFILVNKIENYLGIRIKDEFKERSFEREVEEVKDEFEKKVLNDEIKFDDITTKTLTISDLQDMRKKREEEIFNEKEENEKSEEKIDLDKGDLSKEDIDKIIFGK